MRYICLDTNIYIGCALLTEHQQEPKHLKRIKNIIVNHDVKFLVPEVIKSEFYGRIREKNEIITKELDGLKGKIGKESLTSDHDKKQLQEYINKLKETRDKALTEAQTYIEDLFSSHNTIDIPLTPDILVQSYLRQVSNLRPFIKENYSKNRPFPIAVDCVIIESLKKFFLENDSSTNSLYFCSIDSDFYEDVSPHPDIKDIVQVELNMFKTLPELLEYFGEQLSKEEKEQFIKIQGRMTKLDVPTTEALFKAIEQMNISTNAIQNAIKQLDVIPTESILKSIRQMDIPINALDSAIRQMNTIGDTLQRAQQMMDHLQGNKEDNNDN